MIEARHLCIDDARGGEADSMMVTSSVLGCFAIPFATREEFLSLSAGARRSAKAL